ncbi:alpha tubulin suppressor [Coemansia sp. BCRC 34301]|nr:alpha tubulin suppressor [Coemansia sp. BCRC 34301]
MVLINALGSNSGGQLATGDMEDAHYLSKTQFSPEVNIDTHATWRVHGGGNHAYAWTDGGATLLACGSNSDGELAMGGGRGPVLCWTSVAFPGCLVRQAACGWSHTLLLNDSGQVYATGSGTFGQLGVGGSQNKWTHVAIPADTSIVSIACGMRHSLALDKDGLVYGWGANRSGQLGITATDQRSPNILAPTPISRGLLPIAMIACGRSHSILVAKDLRTVYVAGQDKYAQFGPASSQGTAGSAGWHSFQLPRAAAKLCSGWDFGAILLESAGSSNVVVWGRADQGQLACKVDDGCCHRRELGYVNLPEASDIVCGSSHVVAMTEAGSVYMWGWNEHGNAGDPVLENVHTPLLVRHGHGAVSIGCGYGNSYIIELEMGK